MIIGIGCDLCAIDRMANFIKNERFLSRVFTEAELQNTVGIEKRRTEHLAGLFAAKEAVAKALGTGFVGFGPKDIEILSHPSGQPYPELHAGALRRITELCPQAPRIHLSISHDGNTAAAFAVIES